MSEITYEDFTKISLKVGKIISAEIIPDSNKLLKLQIDIDGISKQCISGILGPYSPNDLESKLVAVLTNLKPRKILGFESQVMLLAAVNDSDISLIIPDKTIPVGSDIS